MAAAFVLAVPGLPPSAQDETPAAPPEAGVGGQMARSSEVELKLEQWGRDYQVDVKGGDPLTRVKIRNFVNERREHFRWLLFKIRLDNPKARSVWSIPIRVTLWGSFQDVHTGPDTIPGVTLQPDGKFVLNLDVKLHDRFDEETFQRDLVNAFLIEQILTPYASRPDGLAVGEVKPPAWLVHGFDQLVSHRRGGSPSSYYRSFLENGQLLKPEDLFAQQSPEKLDPVRYAIFRASASVMVEALLDQPDGDVSLRGLLGDLGQASPPGVEVLLRQHFPAIREMEQGLEKWWALELASLGQRKGFEYLGWKETERLLSEALQVRFEAKTVATPVAEPAKRGLRDWFKGKPAAPPVAEGPFDGTLDQYEQFLGRSGVKQQVAAVYDRIQMLKRSGFPLYRPVFVSYETILAKLAKGDTAGLPAEFAAAEELRTKIHDTLVRAEDYLNHFEAARAPRRSGAFDDYIEMRRALDRKPPPKRHDTISVTLDELEREFR